MDLSVNNIKKNHADLLNGRVLMVEGDGRKGYEQCAPYKAIHVGAAAPSLPEEVILLFFFIITQGIQNIDQGIFLHPTSADSGLIFSADAGVLADLLQENSQKAHRYEQTVYFICKAWASQIGGF